MAATAKITHYRCYHYYAIVMTSLQNIVAQQYIDYSTYLVNMVDSIANN